VYLGLIFDVDADADGDVGSLAACGGDCRGDIECGGLVIPCKCAAIMALMDPHLGVFCSVPSNWTPKYRWSAGGPGVMVSWWNIKMMRPRTASPIAIPTVRFQTDKNLMSGARTMGVITSMSRILYSFSLWNARLKK